MTDLTPISEETPVPQLETTTLALGGTGNPMNLQAQALLNRTQFLREQQVADQLAIAAIGSTSLRILGDYAAGLEFTTRNQAFRLGDDLYVAPASLPLPYTTDGSGAAEIALFDAIGDPALRAEMAVDDDPTKGSALVGHRGFNLYQKLNRVSVDAKDFGAVGDGVADDTAAIQTAIDEVELLGGGRVLLTGGDYLISATLRIKRGVYLVAEDGWGDVTANANGTSNRQTTIAWSAAAAAAPMLQFKANALGEYIYGGGVIWMLINGNNIASLGIDAQSTSDMLIDVQVRQVTVGGVKLSAENGKLSQFNRVRLGFTYGSLAGVENADGIILDGNLPGGGANNGCTQNIIESAYGLIHSGAMVRIIDADNNHIQRLHASKPGGATGHGLYLANGIDNNARNNVVDYVVGDIHAESATRGNVLKHVISEGTSITADAGAQMHYEAVDYVTADRWSTPIYAISDARVLTARELGIDGSAAYASAASLWSAVALSDASNGGVSASFSAPLKWHDGEITGLRIRFAMGSANVSANARFRVRAGTYASAASIATPEHDENFTVAVPDAANATVTRTLSLSTPLSFLDGNAVFINLQRLPLDALDTAAGALNVLTVEVLYRGLGPNSAGSGPFAEFPPFV